MRRTMIGLAILIIMCARVRSAMAGDKIDVPKVITKSDAEKNLGAPVKDAKGRNQNGADGYYAGNSCQPVERLARLQRKSTDCLSHALKGRQRFGISKTFG